MDKKWRTDMARDKRTFDDVGQAKRVLTALETYGQVDEVTMEVEVSNLDIWSLLEDAMEPDEGVLDGETIEEAEALVAEMEESDDEGEKEVIDEPERSGHGGPKEAVQHVDQRGDRKQQVIEFLEAHPEEWVDWEDFAEWANLDVPDDETEMSVASSALSNVRKKEWLEPFYKRRVYVGGKGNRTEYYYGEPPEDELEPTDRAPEEGEEESEESQSNLPVDPTEAEWESESEVGLIQPDTNMAETLQTVYEMTDGRSTSELQGGFTSKEITGKSDLENTQVQPALTQLYGKGAVGRKKVGSDHPNIGFEYRYAPTEHGVKQVEKWEAEA